jgi:predicted cytidylate kinase
MVTITISGSPGSGKTTVARILAEKLGLKYVYSGKIFREMAEKYKMNLEEFGAYCEKHEEVDKQLDDYQLEILKKGNVIAEGRIAGWIAHRNNISAVKVLLLADLETRSKRIVNREEVEVEKRKNEILTREKSEAVRYKAYYKIDLVDTSIYDLVVDSSNKTPEEIVDLILEKIDQ